LPKTVLITGAAGFIGSHVCEGFLQRGDNVVALDNLNDYYDPARKRVNIKEVANRAGAERAFSFVVGDVRDRPLLATLFTQQHFDAVIHLAAMAGVRNSIHDPALYYDVNLNGTLALLDASTGRLPGGTKAVMSGPFVLASTSSVYGATDQIPFVETDCCDRPLAPYAASKRAAELLGHTYHHLYGLNFTALRFFTVYGPRGRPDMMAYKVADSIFHGTDVPLFNNGQMHRDWTYVEDVVTAALSAADRPLGYEVINLGRGQPVLLADFVTLIEKCAGRKAKLVPGPMPDSDVPRTYADVSKAAQLLGYKPSTSVEVGVPRFWDWYRLAVASQHLGRE
jgi:UDP-glucuronate 4-epimerase